MDNQQNNRATESVGVTTLYHEHEEWQVNSGEQTIHAKRMPGKFRSIKNLTESFWLVFFFGAYLRWNDKQAILFDVTNRQFHFFNLTVMPQDIWVGSLVLLLLAMTLFAVTTVASRVFCGFFCFQSSWVDWFTWIEEKIEGNHTQRQKLEKAPMSMTKFRLKLVKHVIWLSLAIFTGISFSVWFVDAHVYWHNLLTLQLPLIGWVVLIMFTGGTYVLAGFMREQACMWLCPYARIQAVMLDAQTILPTYDVARGEPRGKIRRGEPKKDNQGDCIDCYQCVQVCPTGVDIRLGQQLGCITCGLCLDACDSIMDKIGRPRGLIRYASLDEMEGRPVKKLYQHPRVFVYLGILLLSFSGIVYGLTHMGSLSLRVEPERQPLFVQMSDGSIQNKYTFKVVNKTDKDVMIKISAEGGVKDQVIVDAEQHKLAVHGKATAFTVFVKASDKNILKEVTKLQFRVEDVNNPTIAAEYNTVFNGPKH